MNLVRAVLGDMTEALDSDTDAIICDGIRISYRELKGQIDRYGNALRQLKVQRRRRLVFVSRDTPEFIFAFFAAMKLGAVPVVASERTDEGELEQIIRDSQADFLVCDDQFRARCEALKFHGQHHLTLLCLQGDNEIHPVLAKCAHSCSDGLETCLATLSDEAFWICSSGSTGRPKAVVHTHGPLHPACTYYHTEVLGLGRGDLVFCTSKLPFAYALGNGLLAPLKVGATVVLHPEWSSARSTLELIERHGPKAVFSTPSLYRSLLHELNSEGRASLQRVSHFVSAGEHLPGALIKRWKTETGRLIQDCYGCSETVFFALASIPEESSQGSVGKPIPGVEVRIVPHRRDDNVALGQLWLRHPFQAAGYGALQAETERRFKGGWFATGDLFEIDQAGCWHHKGREDDLIKIAGQWVHIREVENSVASESGVSESAAVTACDHDGLLRIALFIVPAEGEDPRGLLQRVKSSLAIQLPRRKRPRWLEVVDALPRTTTGKIRRQQLREWIEVQDSKSGLPFRRDHASSGSIPIVSDREGSP